MENENLYTFENPDYRKTYWHSCSHIMAQAVKRQNLLALLLPHHGPGREASVA